jgi:hypothetical protein
MQTRLQQNSFAMTKPLLHVHPDGIPTDASLGPMPPSHATKARTSFMSIFHHKCDLI